MSVKLLRNLWPALAAAVLVATASGVAAQQKFYRYVNEKGVVVINDRIPPEFVAKGYDVVLNDGTVLQRVPRQLTEEELLHRNTDESRARLREEEEEKLRQWDESLLLRYSNVEDIEAARDRAQRDLQIRITILRSNLMSVKTQIEAEQAKAADLERNGTKVPKELTDKIQVLRLEIEDTEESIRVRQQEIESTRASYQRDMDRFTLLQDRVNARGVSRERSESKDYY